MDTIRTSTRLSYRLAFNLRGIMGACRSAWRAPLAVAGSHRRCASSAALGEFLPGLAEHFSLYFEFLQAILNCFLGVFEAPRAQVGVFFREGFLYQVRPWFWQAGPPPLCERSWAARALADV